MEKEEKDRWDKVSIILQPVGGLLTALSVAALGLFGAQFMDRRQSLDTNVRLYSELMSKREESESALRKDMFVSIIQTFLKPGSSTIDAKLLNLELLSYNFHESLNLKPLFLHLKRQIQASPNSTKPENLERLQRVAKEVTRKEMLILEDAGKKSDRTIDFETLRKHPAGVQMEDVHLQLDGIGRDFRVLVKQADPKTQEIQVRLEIRTPKKSGEVEVDEADFWVGFFDFPMIDNTRLSDDQRCAVILNKFGEDSAEMTLVYFPGTYASLKEKPYYEEVIQNLLKTSRLLDERKAK